MAKFWQSILSNSRTNFTRSTYALCSTLIVLLLSAPLAKALDHHLPGMISRLDQVKNNPTQLADAQQAGKERITLCKYCHGEDGRSVRSNIPNLAGQNAQYLVTQFELFASGERKDYVMEQLAGNLTEEERINIALYYSSLPAAILPTTRSIANEVTDRSLELDPEQIEAGRNLYQNQCLLCHGVKGAGGETIPRIAAQPYPYLNNTLTDFSSNNTKRRNSPMVSIMKDKTEQEIDALAAYLSSIGD